LNKENIAKMDSMLISINIIKDNLKKELSTAMENLQILNKNILVILLIIYMKEMDNL